jgi:hypothetical protein
MITNAAFNATTGLRLRNHLFRIRYIVYRQKIIASKKFHPHPSLPHQGGGRRGGGLI